MNVTGRTVRVITEMITSLQISPAHTHTKKKQQQQTNNLLWHFPFSHHQEALVEEYIWSIATSAHYCISFNTARCNHTYQIGSYSVYTTWLVADWHLDLFRKNRICIWYLIQRKMLYFKQSRFPEREAIMWNPTILHLNLYKCWGSDLNRYIASQSKITGTDYSYLPCFQWYHRLVNSHCS